MKFKKVFILLVISAFNVTTQAQESPVSSGGDVTGTNGSVCYFIGQVVYTTNTTSTGYVSQGFQQPYEIRGISRN